MGNWVIGFQCSYFCLELKFFTFICWIRITWYFIGKPIHMLGRWWVKDPNLFSLLSRRKWVSRSTLVRWIESVGGLLSFDLNETLIVSYYTLCIKIESHNRTESQTLAGFIPLKLITENKFLVMYVGQVIGPVSLKKCIKWLITEANLLKSRY